MGVEWAQRLSLLKISPEEWASVIYGLTVSSSTVGFFDKLGRATRSTPGFLITAPLTTVEHNGE